VSNLLFYPKNFFASLAADSSFADEPKDDATKKRALSADKEKFNPPGGHLHLIYNWETLDKPMLIPESVF
jgi:hypothetical protein